MSSRRASWLYAEECFHPIVRNVLGAGDPGGPGQASPGNLSVVRERQTYRDETEGVMPLAIGRGTCLKQGGSEKSPEAAFPPSAAGALFCALGLLLGESLPFPASYL